MVVRTLGTGTIILSSSFVFCFSSVMFSRSARERSTGPVWALPIWVWGLSCTVQKAGLPEQNDLDLAFLDITVVTVVDFDAFLRECRT